MADNNTFKKAAHRIALHGAVHISGDLPTTVPEAVSTEDQPVQDAIECVKNGAVDATLAAGDISADAARVAHLRIRTMREKALEEKPALRVERELTTKPAKTRLQDSLWTTPSIRVPAETQRKEQVCRQLFAQKAVERQAERVSLQNNAGTAMLDQPSRLTHWQQETKRRIFRQNALWWGQPAQAKATGRRLLTRLTLQLHGFRAMHTRMQSAAGRALNRLAAALAKTARAAVRTVAAWIGVGSVVLLLVIVVGAAAAIIGSPMGILFADETGDPNAIPIACIVQETNAAFGQAINEIVAAHPECDEVDIQYHYEAGRTWQSYWPEVLAVFSVQANLGEDGNVVVIDAANAQKIQDTFWTMHEITSEVETVEIEPEPEESEENGENSENGGGEEAVPAPQYRYILHLSVSGRTADEMADSHHFTADQRDILNQLLSDEMRPMLLTLCGTGMTDGIGAAQGSLLWPLPGFATISCGFGEPDAIHGQPHKGIDIPAPEGTPILAAHDGTVLVSGWNDSYGNQVLLDNGAGLSTRYAHMIQTAVTAGETVTAGQVIGYVGSTGNSTGSHLHFEVAVNSERANPVDLLPSNHLA